MKRIVISDIHIGSRFYNKEELFEFLVNEEYDQLILAGDIVDFIKIPLFTKRCLDIISLIGEEKNVVYVVGNHDDNLSNLVGQSFSNIEFCKQYEFVENERKFHIEHGDRFDKGWLNGRLFVIFLSVMQQILEFAYNFDFTSWWAEKQIKKHKLRNVIDILDSSKDCDVFIMGHNHNPEALVWVKPDQSIRTYINCGDWVSHQTYIEIVDDVARLKEFRTRK